MSIEDTKNALRNAYITFRRKKMPNYRGGEKLEAVLDKAATNCLALKADPMVYVEALYNKYGKAYDNFFPNILVARDASTLYRQRVEQLGVITPELLWTSQLVTMKRMLDTGRKVEDILYDPSSPLTPWFRIIISKVPVPEVIARYGPEAVETLTDDVRKFLLASKIDLTRIDDYAKYRD